MSDKDNEHSLGAKDAIDREVFESAPIPKAVRYFVIPALISSTITLIYGLVDAYFVGLMGDPNMMAGLTVAFPYYQYLQAFSNLWGVGANTVMSVALGKGDTDRVSRSSLYGFWGGIVFMAVLSVVSIFVSRPLLYLAGASSATIGFASDFMFWSFTVGGIPCLLSIVMANLLRAEGHAKAASFGLAMGGILNMFFDPLFMFALNMNVAGAAMADTAAALCSFIYFVFYWRKIRDHSYIKLVPYSHKFRLENLVDVFVCGLPSGWLTILGATGCLVQTHLYSLTNDAAVAAWGVTNRMSFVGINTTHGIAQGILPLVGYNFGSGNMRRARSVISYAFKLLMCVAFALLILCELFPTQIMRFFIKDPLTVTEGTIMLRVYMLCTPLMSTILFISTMCQAIKKPQFSLGLLTGRQAINIPLTFMLQHFFGMVGVSAGQPSCEMICLIPAILVFRHAFGDVLGKAGDEDVSDASPEMGAKTTA